MPNPGEKLLATDSCAQFLPIVGQDQPQQDGQLFAVKADRWRNRNRSNYPAWTGHLLSFGLPAIDACIANSFIEEKYAVELASPDLRGLGRVTSLVHPTGGDVDVVFGPLDQRMKRIRREPRRIQRKASISTGEYTAIDIPNNPGYPGRVVTEQVIDSCGNIIGLTNSSDGVEIIESL